MKTIWTAAPFLVFTMGLPAMAQGTTTPQTIAPPGAVACVSARSILHYSDAVDSGDRKVAQQLLAGQCRPLDGSLYQLLEEHNGTTKILVFKKRDDWETAEVYYSLAEMLQLE
jgi:hypothetical protein